MSIENKPDPQSVVDETRKFWQSIAQETVRNSVTTIDETARQIITVIAILEGLYFHAITYSEVRIQELTTWMILAYIGPLIFWLLSLISGSLVFFPRVYQLMLSSSESAKTWYEDVVSRKYFFLRLSFILLVLGSVFLFLPIIIYLQG